MIGSLIAMFCTTGLFLAVAYLFAFSTDELLHERTAYDSYQTISLKSFHWLFWHCKKASTDEIYLVAFVEELLSIVMLFALIAALVISLIFENELIMLVGLIVGFLYLCFTLFNHNRIQRKYKK